MSDISNRAPQRNSIAGRRRNRIAGQFTALLTEMLESPAWCVLSLSARRVLDRVCIELRHHGGHAANGLCVTYDDFQEYGIDRHAIALAIREVVALGFLTIIRQGRAGNREYRQATLYRPTFATAVDFEATHEWRRIRTLEQARTIAAEARAPKRRTRNRKPVGVSPPIPVGVSRTENRQIPVGVPPTTVVAFSPTTSDISGGWSGGQGGGKGSGRVGGHVGHRSGGRNTRPARTNSR
jgi:hypothetical protein